jgi:FlaG/FlaF family flagellin (archaellin)
MRKRRGGGGHSGLIWELVIVAITILLGIAIYKFALGYMGSMGSAPGAQLGSVQLSAPPGGPAVLTVSVTNTGSVPIECVNVTKLGNWSGSARALGPIGPGGSASAALTPGELPALARVSPGQQYRVALLVCFAGNSTQALTADVMAVP